MADDSEVASKVKVKEMQGRNMKILLVEDNPGDARLIRERLKEASDGWVELVEAGRLDEALKLVKQSSFDNCPDKLFNIFCKVFLPIVAIKQLNVFGLFFEFKFLFIINSCNIFFII